MSEDTKILYYVGNEQTPYVKKVNIPPQYITLGDFKAAVKKPNFKFFFRSNDQDFGVVKEEISNDDNKLPFSDNRVVAWLVAPDEDTVSQSSVTSCSSNLPQPEKFFHQHNGGIGRNSTIPDGIVPNYAERPTRQNLRMMYNQYGSESTLVSSDLESTTSWDSRDDTSEYSTYSEMTASSRYTRPKRQRYRKKRPQLGSDTTSVYSSSITDSSMSLNILSVTLNMDKHKFLGISIVGQSNDKGDGGIYIGSIMKGGAVASDGRIEPGDMLLQVNDVNFEDMSNEDAVRELRNIVHKPGPITLTVAKCWDPHPENNLFTIPKDEPVRPIDPAVWATQTSALQGNFQAFKPPHSVIHGSSDTLASSLPESERYDQPLSIHTDMAVVVRTLKMPDCGLEIKTRMWLKISIPNSFIGSDLVDWLQQKVDGLSERRSARKYASSLLKMGYIRHTVNKITFSEQCYYVFGDYTGHNLPKDLSTLSLDDSNSDKDADSLGPLNHYVGGLPWSTAAPLGPGAYGHGYPSYSQAMSHQQQPHLSVLPRPCGPGGNGVVNPGMNYPPPQSYSGAMSDHQSDIETLSLHSAGGYAHSQRAYSQSSLPRQHLASFGGSRSGGSGSDQASESRYSCRSSRSGSAGSSGGKPRSRLGSDRNFEPDQPQLHVNRSAQFESPLPPQPPPR